jgi:hypothetical protein
MDSWRFPKLHAIQGPLWSVPESETHLHQDALITTMRMLGTEASLIGASAHILGAGMKLE